MSNSCSPPLYRNGHVLGLAAPSIPYTLFSTFFIQSKKITSNILQNKLKYFISSFFALFLRTFFLRMLNTKLLPLLRRCYLVQTRPTSAATAKRAVHGKKSI